MTPILILLFVGLTALMTFIRKIKKPNNRTYYAEVKNQWINGKVKQFHIRYVGPSPNAPVRKFQLGKAQLKSVAKIMADGSLTPDEVFDMLEKQGEPVTRFELEKMGIEYRFEKKTSFIILYPLKTAKRRGSVEPAERA